MLGGCQTPIKMDDKSGTPYFRKPPCGMLFICHNVVTMMIRYDKDNDGDEPMDVGGMLFPHPNGAAVASQFHDRGFPVCGIAGRRGAPGFYMRFASFRGSVSTLW